MSRLSHSNLEERERAEFNRVVKQEMRSCVHFNGIQNEKCRAGINYHAQFGSGFGCFKHLTCLSDPEGVPCDHSSYPTREQAEATIREQDRKFDAFMVLISAAKKDAREKGFGVGNPGTGELPCPSACGGTIRYAVAVNGHMHAACSNCGSWME